MMENEENDKYKRLISLVVSLIRAHYEQEPSVFRKNSRLVADLFDSMGKTQLSLYISGLLGDVDTWIPMDTHDGPKKRMRDKLEEIDSLSNLFDIENSDGVPFEDIKPLTVSHSRAAVHVRGVVRDCLGILEEMGNDHD